MPQATCTDKVLVIDDELGPRESLRMLLKHEFDVRCVDSVDAGVKSFREWQPHVVVLDIRMPDKSGIEGLREIRAMDPNVSVIMLTGYGALETAQEALRLNATDYLRKPFDTKEMIENIRRCAERTRLERRRNRTERGLKVLNQRLLGELSQMERMAALGQASAELLHDLRNPLTIVLGYVEILADHLAKAKTELGSHYDETAKFIDIIEKNVERCQQLARMWKDEDTAGLQIEPVGIADLMEEVRASTEFLAADEHASVQYDLEANGARVMASRPQLLRAVHNVVSNAIHAVAETGGCIRIISRQGDDDVQIQVVDNGCGIATEDLKRIFEPYFTKKLNGKGTGLGLAITKRIVEDCRGGIDVVSRPGEGTAVTLRLPLMKEGGASPA
ncbi:MAG: hybrid sensor histidine kinase/response regulator [Kiritimatiellae bacterium]|nr:hybrid sensor histidine kinase/response regulator [Kiritimatiellia bacterium]